MDINNFTAEQKAELKRQLAAEEKAEKENAKKQKDAYLSMKECLVRETFEKLTMLSTGLAEVKEGIFNDFKPLLALKCDLYGITEKDLEIQQSHTFTTEDQKISIIIGSNVVDGWTDDVGVGIGRVIAWADSMTDSPNSTKLATYLKQLCRPDKNGILKASRVLDMSKQAAEFGDQALIDAVEFIRAQYRPVKTSTYVKAKYLDENQTWQWLALSMSAV